MKWDTDYPLEVWSNVSLVDNTGRPKSLVVGVQQFEANRAGLMLHKSAHPHVVFCMDQREFELQPKAAREVALAILDICNKLQEDK